MGGHGGPLRRAGRGRRVRADDHADPRARRRVPARHRRGERGRRQGDVRLRGPRRPADGAAPGGHRPHRPRLRAAPPRAAVEGVVRRALVPAREPPARALPPAPPIGRRGTRPGRRRPRRRGGRAGPRLLRRPRPAPGDAAVELHGRRGVPARVHRAAERLPRPSGPTNCARPTGSVIWRTRCACSTASRRSAGPPRRRRRISSIICATRAGSTSGGCGRGSTRWAWRM